MAILVGYRLAIICVTLLISGNFVVNAFYFNDDDTCECGVSNDLKFRIIGGVEIQPHAVPWMVLILNDGQLHCGGALINDMFILTAGHCLKWTPKNRLRVLLGVHSREFMFLHKHFSPEIEKLIIHENFTSYDIHDTNDIALIKLKNRVKFSDTIRPICLPASACFPSARATVLGWGKIEESGPGAENLQGTSLRIMSNKECRKTMIGDKIIDTMLCAIGDHADACQGDSGGPLLYKNDYGAYEIIGIVSWGIGCANPGVPGIYTRVSSYINWILDKTRQATYCKRPEFIERKRSYYLPI